MTMCDFALVPDERVVPADCVPDTTIIERNSAAASRLEEKRSELHSARADNLARCGARTINAATDLVARRDDLLLFYGRLCRRDDAIQASLEVDCADALHWALVHEVCFDVDTIEGYDLASVETAGSMASYLNRLITEAIEETQGWEQQAA